MAISPETIQVGSSLLSGVLGGVGGYMSAEAKKDALNELKKFYEGLDSTLKKQMLDQYGLTEETFQPIIDAAGGTNALEDYYSELDKYNAEEYVPQGQDAEFEFDENLQTYMDPALALRNRLATESRQAAFGQAGSLFSGGAARQLAQEAEERADTAVTDSFNRMTSNRASKYQMFKDKLDRNRQIAQDKLGLFKQGIELKGMKADDVSEAMKKIGAGKQSALSDYQGDELSRLENIATTKAKSKGISPWGSALSGFTGGMKTGSDIGNMINSFSSSKPSASGSTSTGTSAPSTTSNISDYYNV